MTTTAATAPSETSNSETVRKGKEIYEARLRAELEDRERGKYLAIDTESGEHWLAEDGFKLAELLKGLGPSRTRFIMRIGYPTMSRMGGSWPRPQQKPWPAK